MREDLVQGSPFPDIALPEHTGRELSLSTIAQHQPLVLCFVRGWWCPKEQVRVRGLVEMQEEIQREYGKIALVTVDEPYVNGAFRAGLGASFPFLSDEERRVAEELDLLELTDDHHRPYLPFTFVLDSSLRIHSVWCGFWYWGNPTPEELRLALREITRAEQPTFEPQRVWQAGGSAPAASGMAGETIWIREDAEGREFERGLHSGPLPEVGTTVARSRVDGRAWVVHEIEQAHGRAAVHLRKIGEPHRPARLVPHSMTTPLLIR